MKINANFYISMERKTKEIYTNLFDGRAKIIRPTETVYSKFNSILRICRKRKVTIASKNDSLSKNMMDGFPEYVNLGNVEQFLFETEKVQTADGTMVDVAVVREKIVNAIRRLTNFFSEFGVTPSRRFINNLSYATNKTEYVRNYFMVQGHTYASEIMDKIKSPEWSEIASDFSSVSPTKERINTHIDLYFGAPGTGKTTKAMEEADGGCVVCSSDMLPVDIMQNFGFADGKAEYSKSDLWKAMEEGKTIVLDEINMLPFETLRFLQGITDGKSEFDFKGNHIDIHPNFRIIGTMNLMVNGQSYVVPEPIVDRCAEIKEFTVNAEELADSVL